MSTSKTRITFMTSEGLVVSLLSSEYSKVSLDINNNPEESSVLTAVWRVNNTSTSKYNIDCDKIDNLMGQLTAL